MARTRLWVGLCAAALVRVTGCGASTPNGTGGAGTAQSTSIGAGGAAAVAACEACLDAKCKDERAACDDECYALQGCIDAVCFHLSAIGAPDEGACQTYCQNLHPLGAVTQLAYVNCAASEPAVMDAGPTCLPPCYGAPQDFEQCAGQRAAGPCSAQVSACAASPDCVAYEACASTCTTALRCQACSESASGAAGEATFQALQVCIARGCLAEEWLPHF